MSNTLLVAKVKGSMARRRSVVRCCAAGLMLLAPGSGMTAEMGVQAPATIARVKESIVAIGTFQKTRVPQFRFSGTGFAVGDGNLIATNAHVVPAEMEAGADPEFLAIALPTGESRLAQVRMARRIVDTPEYDLALLRFTGPALPALQLRDSDSVREGEQYVFTGFPIGSVLGLFPATHRAMIASITPIAIPAARAEQLKAQNVRRLQSGAFPVFQLDATSYPGNSGSPLYDSATGEVIGVLNMVLVKSTKESALTNPSGISYAIPSNHLAPMIAATK